MLSDKLLFTQFCFLSKSLSRELNSLRTIRFSDVLFDSAFCDESAECRTTSRVLDYSGTATKIAQSSPDGQRLKSPIAICAAAYHWSTRGWLRHRHLHNHNSSFQFRNADASDALHTNALFSVRTFHLRFAV